MNKQLIAILVFWIINFSLSTAQQSSKLKLGGFGEMKYQNVIYEKNTNRTPGVFDFQHFNFLAEYNFNDWINFHSEVGLEHALVSPGSAGEFAIYQAFIDFKIQQEFGIRAGILLVPSGLTNLNRSPINYHGVERPNVEKFIIPTTWRETGIGIYGETDFGLSYKTYVLAGLDPAGITGREGIRRARQNAFQSSTANVALGSGIDYQINTNLTLGTSYYISSIKNNIENGSPVSDLDEGFFNMLEGHAQYRGKRFEARGLFAYGRILDVEDLNRAFGNAAGQMQVGGYIELAYDILSFFNHRTEQKLYVFSRGESYDTNFFTGNISRNDEFLREELILGFTYNPVEQVVIKADYQFLTSLGTKYVERLNLSIGYNLKLDRTF